MTTKHLKKSASGHLRKDATSKNLVNGCNDCCCFFPSSVTATFSGITKKCFGPFGLGYYSINDSVFDPVSVPETSTCSGSYQYHPSTPFDHYDLTTPCADFLNLETGDTLYSVYLQVDTGTGIVHIYAVEATSALGAAGRGSWFSFTASGAISTWPVFGDTIPNDITCPTPSARTGCGGSVVIS